MVTIVNFKKTIKEDGTEFFLLELNGGIEFVKSLTTGKMYATMRKCFISTTFSEDVCRDLVGTKLGGSIAKVSCDPFEYVNKTTGEIVKLDFRYEYSKDLEVVDDKSQVVHDILGPTMNSLVSLN